MLKYMLLSFSHIRYPNLFLVPHLLLSKNLYQNFSLKTVSFRDEVILPQPSPMKRSYARYRAYWSFDYYLGLLESPSLVSLIPRSISKLVGNHTALPGTF